MEDEIAFARYCRQTIQSYCMPPELAVRQLAAILRRVLAARQEKAGPERQEPQLDPGRRKNS